MVGGDTATPVLAVGTIRVGDRLAVTIHNDGAQTTLRGAVGGASAPGVALSGAESFALAPGEATGFVIAPLGAGVLDGKTVSVRNAFANVADQTLILSGTANNLAVPVFTRFGTALAFDSALGGYVLDLGTVTRGGVLGFGGFGLGNLVSGPAGDLSGLVTGAPGGVFSLGGAFDIGRLAAGAVSGPFMLFLDRSSLGLFTGRLTFSGRGTNASDPVGLPTSATLFLTVRVIPGGTGGVIPEPATWAMMISGFGLLGAALRRTRRRAVPWPGQTGSGRERLH